MLLLTPKEVKDNFEDCVRNIQKGPNGDFCGDGCLEEFFYRIFGTVLITSLHNSFTAHLRLSFLLVICILSTGLSLILACTSPLSFDSTDWQLQWQYTGGTVRIFYSQ